MNMLRIAFSLSLLFWLPGCEDSEIQPSEPTNPVEFPAPADGQSLSSFIRSNNLTEQPDSLIACAFSGDHAFLPEGLEADVRILAYSYFPEGDFLYFHSTDRVAASADLSHYTYRRALGARNVASSFFEAFPMAQPTTGTFERMIVARVIQGKIYLSNPIFIKGVDELTVAFPQALALDDQASGNPSFTWPESPGDNVIYFQLLTDRNDRVVSGTYTVEPEFAYYQTGNVVLNVSPGVPPTSLPANNGPYRMTVMGVGANNWVNFIRDISF